MHWQTVTPQLSAALERLMQEPLFASFRLVGGTALSLQLGHRVSVDIDMFTDIPYGSVDFGAIDKFLRDAFDYVWPPDHSLQAGMGQSYIIGNSQQDSIKLDLYYTDLFAWAKVVSNGIRMAAIEEIAAMKMDIVQRTGRKKDFWDIHELAERFSIREMIAFHKKRYPYNHDDALIRSNLTNFTSADDDFDPECLKGKHWELVKLDIIEMMEES